jgi:tetratricopeptide (TPR) repeat protein
MLAHCLELVPGFAPARHNIAIVLFRQNRPADALPHLHKLLADKPNDANLRSLLAASLAMTGDTDGAITAYEQVLPAAPSQPKLWLSYGHALKTAGRRADAVRAYRKTLDLAPGLGEAWWSLANLKTEAFSAADIATMQSQLSAAASTDDRLHLHYALGRALEQAENYAASFTHYAEGARLRRGEIRYSAERTSMQLDRTSALLTKAFFAARAGWGCEDPAPIFIVGLPRSGSTLIEQILASHSLVEGTMELPELARIARALGGGAELDRYPDVLADLDAQACAAWGERFLHNTRIYRKSSKPFFVDKMPNNFVHTGLIHLILPRAKIIDARRNPMAAGFSAFKQHFARGQHYSYDLTELGRYINDYAALMAHIDSVLPGRVHRVQYETMVTDTEAEVRRLLAYCGLEYEDACLRFYENGRAVRTASSEQVRRPIFTEGVEHWRHYEAWLGRLKEALLF